MVPLLDLKAQYEQLRQPINEALLRVAASQACILGPEVEQLERDLAEYLNVRHAIGVSSGTDALLIAFMALGIGAGDEVIVPTFSFFATAGCVSRLGALPVFVDVDPKSFNISPQAVRDAITSRTKAIVPVHLFGQAAEMNALMEIQNETGIPIVEDAAQAIGTQTSDGARVGTIGVIGCFSFYPTKNLGAMGDGGLVTTNDDLLAEKMMRLRNHGMEPRYYHSLVGGNFRLDAIQAAVLRVKLPHLPSWHQARRRNADAYNNLFAQHGLSTDVSGTFDSDNSVLIPTVVTDRSVADYHIFNQYTIQTRSRDALRTHLHKKGIGTEIYYPVPFHRQECFAALKTSQAHFPVADSLSSTVLSLPIYPELALHQIEEVVATVAEFERTPRPAF
ncbi:MAG: DegT/DnrJ/EryC1/StrS family aminotransferase [Ignavibacteria bacterium]|nr:DegT/DnrJ/EryC1/StrS family aminotransferase [Ignavibacteria bacterium]